MPIYNPPHKVRTLDVPYKVLVLRADPNFEVEKKREPFYEFSHGRNFYGDTSRRGAYAPEDS